MFANKRPTIKHSTRDTTSRQYCWLTAANTSGGHCYIDNADISSGITSSTWRSLMKLSTSHFQTFVRFDPRASCVFQHHHPILPPLLFAKSWHLFKRRLPLKTSLKPVRFFFQASTSHHSHTVSKLLYLRLLKQEEKVILLNHWSG